MNVLERVIAFIAEQNVDAYFVGGLVRDELLGRAIKRDIDLAIDGNAAELARTFADAIGGAFYLMDEEHDVARVILSDTYIDFAKLRGSLRDDLSTRDFTINAMARQLGSNELTDPFHGQKHLQLKQVCAVSDQVFTNDPVRLLRAVRIARELGFTIGAHTEELMHGDAHLLAFASMERARDEFCKIIALPNGMAVLRQLDELGLLNSLLPEVTALKGVAQSSPHVYDVFDHTLHAVDELEKIQNRGYAEVADGGFIDQLQEHFDKPLSANRERGTLLRLAMLLHDIGKAATRSADSESVVHFYEHEARGAEMTEQILRRLRFSNDEVDFVMRLIRYHLRPAQLAQEANVSRRAAYRFFRDAGDAGIDTCVIALADWRGKATPNIDIMRDAQQRAANAALMDYYFRTPDQVITPPTLIDGKALMKELGIQPGKQIGELLEMIREAQAAGEVKTREQAIALAKKLTKDEGRLTKV